MFYDGLVVPGALLLLASGTWLIVGYHDGWGFLTEPWLVGMVGLFAFEFIEGNTVTRLYFLRLRRLARQAVAEGRLTPDLVRARKGLLASFAHFLSQFLIGTGLAIALASGLNYGVPRLYPWGDLQGRQSMGEDKTANPVLGCPSGR